MQPATVNRRKLSLKHYGSEMFVSSRHMKKNAAGAEERFSSGAQESVAKGYSQLHAL